MPFEILLLGKQFSILLNYWYLSFRGRHKFSTHTHTHSMRYTRKHRPFWQKYLKIHRRCTIDRIGNEKSIKPSETIIKDTYKSWCNIGVTTKSILHRYFCACVCVGNFCGTNCANIQYKIAMKWNANVLWKWDVRGYVFVLYWKNGSFHLAWMIFYGCFRVLIIFLILLY